VSDGGIALQQLVTVTARATLGGCERQLAAHVRRALKVGISAEGPFEALLQVSLYPASRGR